MHVLLSLLLPSNNKKSNLPNQIMADVGITVLNLDAKRVSQQGMYSRKEEKGGKGGGGRRDGSKTNHSSTLH
jgi:hypothetical protein